MTTTTAMRNQEFFPPGMVELVINHMAGCGCDLETSDPEATLVQLGCVSGYLVERRDADADSARLSEPSAAQQPPAGGIGYAGPSEGESGDSR